MAERVALVNLGCPKNLVDAEVMLGHLLAGGFEIASEVEAADVVVVNTCGFLADSASESVQRLLELGERKQAGQLRGVIAAGCMTQRYGEDAMTALPEVDGFLGVGRAASLPGVVRQVLDGERVSVFGPPMAGFESYGLRLSATPGHSSYLKISEGCDRKCAFCVIPHIRGPMVSRAVQDLVFEARAQVARGVRELILIGQDPNRFGLDRQAGGGSGHLLPALLAELNAIEELRWIRLMYLFPDRHVERVLDAVGELPRVCRYVDMPLQHVATTALRRMNRPGGGEQYLGWIRDLRRRCPDVSIRTTFMVGFPGETDDEFAELEAFIEAAELDWVGVFRFSAEEGAPAASLPDQVPARLKRSRSERLMRLQQRVSRNRLRRWIGREVEVVVEHVDGLTGIGRTEGQSPEIDGHTQLDLADLPDTRPGDFVTARVASTEEYDLQAAVRGLLHRPPPRRAELLQLGDFR